MPIIESILYQLERELSCNTRQTTPLRDYPHHLSRVLSLVADLLTTTSCFAEYRDAILDNHSARNIGSLSGLIRSFFFRVRSSLFI